ncbi:MAG TPA: lipoyl synthase, partial [Leptospiraceae bacterium]|nr:lipoyl synthase [Leptospiraceae bacterium]
MNPLKKRPRTKEFNIPIEKPEWMKVRLPFPLPGNNADQVRSDIANSSLHTVCESASCPNLHHCWSRKTATYMLGGDICTRRCAYCDVASGKPGKLDEDEPIRVAESVLKLGLKFVVLTAVNRDDLQDGGASHFADTVNEIRKRNKDIHIEVLIPDFRGKISSLEILFNSSPDIINHNIETVKSLFPVLAPSKKYDISLSVLRTAYERNFTAKSGLILGM